MVVWAPAALPLRCSGPLRRMAAELQLIGTRQLRDHVPLGLEFDHVQLAGQLAPGEKEAWNADALMEGVRVGTRRGDFLAALEDRVKAEETQWAPLLQLHFPDQLDDCLNKVLVERGQRLLRQVMQTWQREGGSYSRNGWRPGRTSARIVSRGRRAWNVRSELQQKVRIAEEQLARTSASLKAIRLWLRRRRQSFYEEGSHWPGRDGTWRPLSDGAACRRHFPRGKRGRTSGPSQEQKETWERRFSKAGQDGGLRPETS